MTTQEMRQVVQDAIASQMVREEHFAHVPFLLPEELAEELLAQGYVIEYVPHKPDTRISW